MSSPGDFWRYGVVKTLRKLKAAALSPVMAARGDGAVRSAYGVLMVPNWQDTTFRYCIFGTYGRDLADLLLRQNGDFAFVDIGDSTVVVVEPTTGVAGGQPVPPGAYFSTQRLDPENATRTHLAAICKTDETTTLYITSGRGL